MPFDDENDDPSLPEGVGQESTTGQVSHLDQLLDEPYQGSHLDRLLDETYRSEPREPGEPREVEVRSSRYASTILPSLLSHNFGATHFAIGGQQLQSSDSQPSLLGGYDYAQRVIYGGGQTQPTKPEPRKLDDAEERLLTFVEHLVLRGIRSEAAMALALEFYRPVHFEQLVERLMKLGVSPEHATAGASKVFKAVAPTNVANSASSPTMVSPDSSNRVGYSKW